MSNPIIKVMVFKPSGKLYSGEEKPLKDEHYVHCPVSPELYFKLGGIGGEIEDYDKSYQELTMANYEATDRLREAIKNNLPEAHDYSPLQGGFGGEWYWTIDVTFPDDERGFCTFHMVTNGN